MAIASSTSSLFLPATRPLKDSSASRSFFKRTCFSKEAASLSLACNSPKKKETQNNNKKILDTCIKTLQGSYKSTLE